MLRTCSIRIAPVLRAIGLVVTAVWVTASAQGQIQTAGTLFVHVDATASPPGNISAITNFGSLGGFFEARGGGVTVPRIAISGASATRGLQFDGGDYMQHVATVGGALIPAPAGLIGADPTRSIEVWAFNPVIDSEETLVSWGRRGGPDGSNMSFNYGSHGQFGAVGHWGATGPDLGWNDAGGAPQAGRWHHLVYNYNGTTTRVYADGVLQNSETLGPATINTHANTPICLATQLEADGITPTPTFRGSLTLAKVRVHDGVLTEAQILNNYNVERVAFEDPSSVPLAAPPAHRYSFNEPAVSNATDLVFADSIGTANGIIRGAGASFSGTRLVLNGGAPTTAAYGDLPNGLLSDASGDSGGSGEITVEGWVRVTGSRLSQRIFDFGSTTGGELIGPGGGGAAVDSFALYGQIGASIGSRRLEVRNSDSPPASTNTVDFVTPTFNTNVQFAVTWNESTGDVLVYENGAPVGVLRTLARFSAITDVNNWLGRANNAADQNGQIEYDELRIYSHVLSPGEVRGSFGIGPNVVNVAGPVGIYAQPQPYVTTEAGSATFSVGASGTPPFVYQWRRNGSPIAGATNPVYALDPAPLADNGAQFSVIISNTFAAMSHFVVSANAELTVLPDTNAPTLVGVIGVARSSWLVVDGFQIEFNEPVSSSTATDLANYTLSGPGGNVTLAGAILDPGQRLVSITTGAPLVEGATYTVRVSNVRDRSAAGNPIAPNSEITFVAGFGLRTVGTVTASNSVTRVGSGFDVTAAGRDIGNAADDFTFHSQLRRGDFDVQVRVESLQLADGYSEAGLMARDGTTTNALYAAVLASPSLGGLRFESRATLGANSVGTGSLPVNYPYTWLRLQRVGNAFAGFGSLDGATWVRLGSAVINDMSSQVYLGFAVSSHNPAASVLARFRDVDFASGGTLVNSLALPFEPLGPSSRRTSLVISEIMYHPPEVPGLSLEYIEIFNGQDYYEDLSGFRIDGDVHYDFPNGTILQSGQFLVIARDPVAVQSYYGISGVLGPWRLQTNVTATTTNITAENLPNSRGTVRLESELGAHLLEVNYDSEGAWPAAADGAGHSLVLARPSYGERNVQAWAASQFIGGSPGRHETYVAEPQRFIVINEFMAHTDEPQVDYVELFNTSTQPVDISGCWLSDDFGTNKFQIPNGTILPARGHVVYDQSQLGFNLSSDGEEILLVNSNRTRVLDAVRFDGQQNGVSHGRYPDGAPAFADLASPSPAAQNGTPLRRDIVINEIMYHPISGNDDDEYVELYNRGGGPVDVGDWRLTDGVTFTIPLNTIINPGTYLVIARNRTNLLARYPNLAANPALVLGNYGGQLNNGGERLALAMPDYSFQTNGSIITTNSFYIVVNEVTYDDGGRWGEWSDGGGSSLELIDARSENRLAANWADSDETTKAPWTLIERTGLIDLGMTTGNGTPNRFEFFIEGAGECLVDDVEVLSNGGTNRVINPGFESGATGWAFQGTHAQTTIQAAGAFTGTQCLRLRAVERGDPGPNRVRTAIATMPTGTTNQATLRARVRWLRGDPNFLMRIRGQWIECPGQMTLPTNAGTPGAANSRSLFNAGPAIYDVTHNPALPAADEPVIVTARLNDPDSLLIVTLRHRIDPNESLIDVAMRDNGTGGDSIAGDGIYSATIPGYPAATMVAFQITARDGPLVLSRFPTGNRECLVRYGETVRAGSITTYRLWLTQSNLTYWGARERNSNEGLGATFVYADGRRVIYNAQTLYSGSPWHTLNAPYTGPLGNTCDYEVNFPKDDLFLGQEDFVLNGQNPVYSVTFNQDVSAQAESTAYWFGRKLGLGFNHKRHVFVSLNGQARGMIYFDHQQPNTDIIEEYYPNDSNGRLHKIEDWFEFDDAGNGFDIITCTLQSFVVGGQKRPERYRWTWRPRAGTGPNDFADLFALVDAANASGPEPYTSATLNLMDMRTSMRVWALQHTIGNWDSYGYERGKNMYAYKPTEAGWRMVLWDLDLVLGKDSRGPTDGLFNNGSEPVVTRMYQHPPFVREYWCAIHELANTWMVPAAYSPLVDARFAAFRANGVPVDSPDGGNSVGATGGMRGWIAARRNYLLSQIPNASFNVTGTNFVQTANNFITVAGWAPVTAKEILVNGAQYPITWTTVSNWTLRVAVAPGTNTLVVTSVDAAGNILSNRTVTVNYTGPAPAAGDSVVISEIMYDPTVDQTSFVELFNRQPNFTFDLSGWRINGLSYSFPPGAVLPPRSYLVLARNRAEFAKLYGVTKLIFDDFSGALDNDGETLTLFRPGSQPAEEIIVDKVKYEAGNPWPPGAAGRGGSLQLIDSAQDNARVSNWSDGNGWRFFTLTGIPNTNRLLIYLNSAASVYMDEIALVAGTVPGVGQNTIVNGGFEEPLAPNWKFLGTVATNTAPDMAARINGDFGLALRFTAPGSGGQYFYQDLPGFASNTTHTLSFWYLPSTNANNLEVRMSSLFRATINARAPSDQNLATPGTNSVIVASIPSYPLLWLNEVLPLNTEGIADGQGEREPWIELYNSGDVSIRLDGFRLTDDYLNLTRSPFPAGAVLDPGQFKIVFADGETNESTADEWHTSFRLTAGTGSVALTRFMGGAPQVVDYLNFSGLPADRSYGSCPDGQLFDRQEMFFTTPGSTNNCAAASLFVHINEWMAANIGFIRDPADNDADDWFELYNPNAFAVDLGGHFLTDNLSNSFQFEIPNNHHYTIAPFGFLLVWADGEPQQNSTNRSDLHVNFQLRQAGEAIGLFAPDGTLIDAVTFDQQTDNVSQGHYPQGTGPILFMTSPSPRAANIDPNPSAPPEIISVTFTGAQVELIVSTVAGRTYRIEFTDDLSIPVWNTIGGNRLASGSSLVVLDNPGSNPQRFYRAVLVQ